MEDPKMLTSLRKYTLITGTGGFAALQVMSWEALTLPDIWRVNLGYFFSIVIIFSVFLGGFSLVRTIKEGQDLISSKLKEEKKEVKKIKELNGDIKNK